MTSSDHDEKSRSAADDDDDDDDDSGSDNGSTNHSSNSQISRPRPQSQVSFFLPPQQQQQQQPHRASSSPSTAATDGETMNGGGRRGALSQSDPCTISSTTKPTTTDAPRNRRRLFRDVSYTNRAVRRDTLEGRRGSLLHRQQNSNNLLLLTSPSSNNNNNSHDGQSSNGGRMQMQPPRRQESFRGTQRRGSGGRAGARMSTRFLNYCEDRAENLNTTIFNRNDNGDDSSPQQQQQHVSLQHQQQQQYYIPPPEDSHSSLLDAIAQLYSLAFGDVAMWVYGASFGKVLLFFLVLYMMFVYCFVVVLYLVDRYYSESNCINGSFGEEEDPLDFRAHFEFAFELSWTTFTTVGYGNVGPPPDVGCYPIRLLCSIEAILGMAFVSMCSGLFYAKLLRLLGRAPVTFSSTLCVQYGDGLEDGGKKRLEDGGKKHHVPSKNNTLSAGLSVIDDSHKDSESMDESEKEEAVDKIFNLPRGSTCGGPSSLSRTEDVHYSFPVIEFRIVNNRANHAPGRSEIWDAEVTALLQLSIENDPHGSGQTDDADECRVNSSSTRWHSHTTPANNNDDPKEEKKGQKVYYKLSLKPSFHPYFSRVWFLRHTLDETSPLLKREVRNAIKDRSSSSTNNMGWDPAYNNYRDIRQCLVEFNSLRILMSGASALSRSEVYAEKVYTYEDVCVGWQYVAVCYEEESDQNNKKRGLCRTNNRSNSKHIGYGDDMTTRVDLSLIHDIVPQKGGNFEPVDD